MAASLLGSHCRTSLHSRPSRCQLSGVVRAKHSQSTCGPAECNGSALVEPTWLHSNISCGGVQVVDGTWGLGGQVWGDEFRRSHLPGAKFFDVDVVASKQTVLPHMVPTLQDFKGHMKRLGLRSDNHLVVYDRSNSFVAAARVWWTLKLFGHRRVSVLNGGMFRWVNQFNFPLHPGKDVEEEHEVEALQDNSREQDNGFSFQPALLAQLDEVLDNITSGKQVVVDARPAGRFYGRDPEPRPGLRGGHIPGSINLPFTELVESHGPWSVLLPREKLLEVFQSRGIGITKPIITTCGSGVTAAVIALALNEVGSTQYKVYDGGWTEWGARSDTPVARE